MLSGLWVLLVLPQGVGQVLMEPASILSSKSVLISILFSELLINKMFSKLSIMRRIPGMANWGVVLAGPLKAGGKVERFVHIVPRNHLVQPVSKTVQQGLELLKLNNRTHFDSLWNLTSSGPASA